MGGRSVARRMIILIGFLVTIASNYGFTTRIKKTLNFQESEKALKSPSTCLSCNKETNLLKAQFHLQLIKERIQTALGINSDELGIDNTTLPNYMRSRVQSVFQDKHNEFSETKTEKQILLAENGLLLVTKGRRRLTFKVPFEAASTKIADLWLPQYFVGTKFCIKMKIRVNGHAVPFSSEFLANEKIPVWHKSDGWLSLSIKNHLQNYIKSNYNSFLGMLRAAVIVEMTYDRPEFAASQESSLKPYMVVELTKEIRKRKRRRADCRAGVKSICCREKLTVDFADIGLQQHIIEPKRFEAYHCVGNCGSYSRSSTTRVDIIKSVMSTMRLKNKSTAHIKFCCTAAKSSPQKLIYYTSDKKRITSRMVDGLVVDECHCL